jgi:hypothetical protein
MVRRELAVLVSPTSSPRLVLRRVRWMRMLPAFEVHIVPAEGEQLTLTSAGRKGQVIQPAKACQS